ncbi:MAG: hypothetical protein MPL62_02275, partial [Alphaproteobacteria bacterium]|nr:hypothetical protein [Alphaproteobacteria bacterium]
MLRHDVSLLSESATRTPRRQAQYITPRGRRKSEEIRAFPPSPDRKRHAYAWQTAGAVCGLSPPFPGGTAETAEACRFLPSANFVPVNKKTIYLID